MNLINLILGLSEKEQKISEIKEFLSARDSNVLKKSQKLSASGFDEKSHHRRYDIVTVKGVETG